MSLGKNPCIQVRTFKAGVSVGVGIRIPVEFITTLYVLQGVLGGVLGIGPPSLSPTARNPISPYSSLSTPYMSLT